MQTSSDTIERAKAFGAACKKGKTAHPSAQQVTDSPEVVTSKDSPGFIANAILMPMINEAIMVLEKVNE